MDEIFSEHDLEVHEDALTLVPRRVAERLKVFPMKEEKGVLHVAMAEPENLLALDELSRVTRCKIRPARASAEVVRRSILRYYSDDDERALAAAQTQAPQAERFVQLVAEPGAVGIVDNLLEAAILERATDIHIEPFPNKVLVRMRVDGVMYDHAELPVEALSSVISRVKILSKMDIAERRLPQDGRFEGKFGGQTFDVRVSTVPSILGENAVLRILPKTPTMMRLADLGLGEKQLVHVEELIQRPHGMMLATGPTGCGKTTTLYACLRKVDRARKNVITIEEPVEYMLPRVTQIQVHPDIGLTFGRGLRHILRQDPDVLMVGEIRDLETVQMAIQSSLTGHLVFSTVHCNDAVGAPVRLVDMGAEPFLVASTLSAVIAQRLLRRICVNCKVEYQPSEDILKRLGLEGQRRTFYRGRGCGECRGTGYRGQIGVFEVLIIDDELRAAIVNKSSASELRRIARVRGVENLRDDGTAKAQQGITTLEEVLRAVYVEE